jgi:hypothetical protein
MSSSCAFDIGKLSKRIDLNRYRKTTPFLRADPKFLSIFSFENFIIETGTITFVSSSQEVYSFTGSYTSTPAAVVTPVDTLGNNEADVNAFVSSISLTEMTVETSEQFSGEVHFQIILLE